MIRRIHADWKYSRATEQVVPSAPSSLSTLRCSYTQTHMGGPALSKAGGVAGFQTCRLGQAAKHVEG
ncbi:unnamed protein product [Ixodes pacificus]